MLLTLRKALLDLAKIPSTDRPSWLVNATESVELLKRNFGGDDEVLIYASGPHFWVHSVLAAKSAVSPPDHSDLANSRLMIDDSWKIQRSYGGGEGHRVFLEPPLSHAGCRSLEGGEKLIFIRSFEGVKSYTPLIEINQKLIHSLGVHFLEERNAYCRLNDGGDIEDVVCLFEDNNQDPWQSTRAVSIRRRDLAVFMALSNTALVARFDFTRFVPGGFSSWEGADEELYEAKDLYYRHRAVAGHASYAHGQIILRTKLTPEDLVEEWKSKEDQSKKSTLALRSLIEKTKN